MHLDSPDAAAAPTDRCDAAVDGASATCPCSSPTAVRALSALNCWLALFNIQQRWDYERKPRSWSSLGFLTRTLMLIVLPDKISANTMNFKTTALSDELNSFTFHNCCASTYYSKLLTGVLCLISPSPSCWLLAWSNVALFHVNRYSAESNSLDHSCSCCRESKSTMKEVVLKCPHGHSISHKYVYVESCSCQDTECSISQSKELETTEENNKASTLNRIKRAISSSFK